MILDYLGRKKAGKIGDTKNTSPISHPGLGGVLVIQRPVLKVRPKIGLSDTHKWDEVPGGSWKIECRKQALS